jgi:hypothetical protein
MTKSGERHYIYDRCTQYHKGDHPRIRLTENDLDQQMLSNFDSIRVEDDEFRDLFRQQLRQATNWEFAQANQEDGNIKKRHAEVGRLQQQLLNLRLLEEIDADTFRAKSLELRDEEAELQLEMERCSRGRHEIIDIAVKAFELSQTLRAKWFTADYAAKRQILEIVCLNGSLDDVNLCATMRKPFDLLAEALSSEQYRGGRTAIELFRPPIFAIKDDIAGLICDATLDFHRISRASQTEGFVAQSLTDSNRSN